MKRLFHNEFGWESKRSNINGKLLYCMEIRIEKDIEKNCYWSEAVYVILSLSYVFDAKLYYSVI